ncbi:MAG: pseudaminic acid synthase [Gracilibacter sp. BRH_c7a]|nr:MAG: pseudaminic acid synthase [Gracilibacter sp. BRH_c7a]
MKLIVLGDREIGIDRPPLIIAEMSGNHHHSLDRALKMIEAAAQAGAHAVKLQTYTADTMTLDLEEGSFSIHDPESLWKGYSLYRLYQEAYTPWEWHQPIFERCRDLGLIAFSSPFDESAVDFLEELNVPCYKIASFENTDLPLIRKAAKTGKPLIVSTGMATLAELDDTVRTIREAGCRDLILLQCTSSYPASPQDSNIATLPHLQELFQCQVGLSDHTLGIGVSVASVALGATVIEKHFTLSRNEGGVDAAFSLEPEEMGQLVAETHRAWLALGKITYGPTSAETNSLKLRRSLYITEYLKKGECLTRENVRIIRPGLGLPPKYYDVILGRQIKYDVPKGTPLSWDLI